MRARGLTVHVDSDAGTGPAVPARVITAISNAAREALSNVVAHAGTAEAWVSVRLTTPDGEAEVPCRLQVSVRDRGIGFDPDRVDAARLGLRRSIAERIADCGGQASIWSQPGQGTVVSLWWPAEWRPAESWPAESWPAESWPAESWPAESWPAESWPAAERAGAAHPAQRMLAPGRLPW
jgi:signal transduction histidine kinase